MDWFGTKQSSRYFESHDVTGILDHRSAIHDPVVEVCLAEFHALREEIGRLREEIAQYQAFALAITVALAPLIGYEVSQQKQWLIPTLAIIPLPFTILGFLFYRQNVEIYIEASYIRDRIRPLLLMRTSQAAEVLWTWEDYKHAAFGMLARKRTLLGRVVGHRLAVFMRVSLFVGPAAAALIIDTILVLRHGSHRLVLNYRAPGQALVISALIVDFLLIVTLLVILLVYGDAAHTVLEYDRETGLRNPTSDLGQQAGSPSSARPLTNGTKARMASVVLVAAALLSLRYATMRMKRKVTPRD